MIIEKGIRYLDFKEGEKKYLFCVANRLCPSDFDDCGTTCECGHHCKCCLGCCCPKHKLEINPNPS